MATKGLGKNTPKANNLGAKKPINRKHINIFLTALVGQSSQGRTPTRPKDKRDTMARFYSGIQQRKADLSQGWVPFCPGEGSHLSQGRFLFVPKTVPTKMFMFIFFCLPEISTDPLRRHVSFGSAAAEKSPENRQKLANRVRSFSHGASVSRSEIRSWAPCSKHPMGMKVRHCRAVFSSNF